MVKKMSDDFNLDKKITYPEVTIRAYNALENNGIKTIRQLLDYTDIDLQDMRNIGKAGLFSIKKFLSQNGYSLRTGTVTKKQIEDNINKIPYMLEIIDNTIFKVVESLSKIRIYIDQYEKEKKCSIIMHVTSGEESSHSSQ